MVVEAEDRSKRRQASVVVINNVVGTFQRRSRRDERRRATPMYSTRRVDATGVPRADVHRERRRRRRHGLRCLRKCFGARCFDFTGLLFTLKYIGQIIAEPS